VLVGIQRGPVAGAGRIRLATKRSYQIFVLTLRTHDDGVGIRYRFRKFFRFAVLISLGIRVRYMLSQLQKQGIRFLING
jgi:hypothetical protein